MDGNGRVIQYRSGQFPDYLGAIWFYSFWHWWRDARAVGLDLSKLDCSTVWNTSNSPYRTSATAYQILELTNTVKVTVSYQWGPEAFWGGITMTSTSESPMWY